MKKMLVYLFFVSCTCATACLAVLLHQNSQIDKKVQEDYFNANQIKYGLLSGDQWTLQVGKIISLQVDSFEFTPANRKIMRQQVDNILNRLLTEVDAVLHKRQEKMMDRIKFKVINAVVDVDQFKKEIPRFSNAILAELDKAENKTELKKLLQEKIGIVLKSTNQDTSHQQRNIITSYGANDLEQFNRIVGEKSGFTRQQQETLGYMLIGVLVLVLLSWIFILRSAGMENTAFVFSVVISFLALLVGASLPMIAIDARIGLLDLELLSSHIIFKDQVIFFQTKSIIDVVHILLLNGKADTVLVGVLVLLFSLIFPITKLICACFYLFSKSGSNKFVKYMSFKSGKWSMADVMVIAIFMAYVGFKGILNDQLEDITVHKESINILTTNRTSLLTGFVLFIAFVLYNLVLAEILRIISKRRSDLTSPT